MRLIKSYNIILVCSIYCLFDSFVGLFSGIHIFGINQLPSLLFNNIIFMLTFIGIIIFSYRKKIVYILITIILGMLLTYLQDPNLWIGNWVINGLSTELFMIKDLVYFSSGISALCFVVICISTLILVYLKYQEH